MTVAEPITAAYRPAEHHAFRSSGKEFVYLVPSGAIFHLQGISKEVFDLLLSAPLDREELVDVLTQRGYEKHEVEATLDDMESCDVVSAGENKKSFPALPEQDFPLQRIVLNTTNQCNLSCGYCYEYSDDKIAKTSGKPKYMTEEIANLLVEELRAKGVGVVIEAVHTCMTIRGVRKPGSICVTSAMKGCFRTKPSTRAELMTLIYGNRR